MKKQKNLTFSEFETFVLIPIFSLDSGFPLFISVCGEDIRTRLLFGSSDESEI